MGIETLTVILIGAIVVVGIIATILNIKQNGGIL